MPVQQYSLSASISCLLVLDSYLATVVWLENDVHGQLTLDRLVTDDCSFFEQQKGANPLKYQNITEWCFSKKKKKKKHVWLMVLTAHNIDCALNFIGDNWVQRGWSDGTF